MEGWLEWVGGRPTEGKILDSTGAEKGVGREEISPDAGSAQPLPGLISRAPSSNGLGATNI